MKKNGIHFVREPKEADYGTVAVFEDLSLIHILTATGCVSLWI